MLKIKQIINGTYYLTCDKKIQAKDKIYSASVENNTMELFCEDTDVEGVYCFGATQLTDGLYHKAGYTWSSRPSCINGQFGMQLVDVIIDSCAYFAVDIHILKTLVEEHTGKKYYIEQYGSAEEPCYRLVEEVL